MMSRSFIAILFFVFMLLQYELWFSQGGIISALQMKQKIAKQTKQNQQMALRNNAVRADIKDLRSGTRGIEERARRELGMVKQGETFYRVVKH